MHKRIVAMICFKAQVMVGCYGVVVASILELIRHQLVHESDPTAFLQLIYEDAGFCLANGFLRYCQLRTAIASAGGEDVARQALGVNADERRLTLRRISLDEGNRTVGFVAGFEAIDPEVAEFCRKCGFRNLDCVHRAKV